jgi:hypothetical protein
MVLADVYEVPVVASLAVIAAILAAAVIASLLRSRAALNRERRTARRSATA